MNFARQSIALALICAFPALWQVVIAQEGVVEKTPQSMGEIIIRASKIKAIEPAATRLEASDFADKRALSSDTAHLLRNIPGLSLYGAGGVSNLPAIHGLADDRIRIKVDDMDLISACANHMNSPLSYIDPSNVSRVTVFAGITPVSVGGDSIAGTIVVNSARPEFSKAGEGSLLKGQAGAFYRSNGNAKGGNLSATLANENLSFTYSGSSAEAGNYSAGRDFKAAGLSTGTNAYVAGNEVASSRYKSENQSLGVALRKDNHLLELKLGVQSIPYQGFPNQRMDMTSNESQQVNFRYTGQYEWGKFQTRVYNEDTQHQMNFLESKLTTANPLGMPMATQGKTTGAAVSAEIILSARDTLKVGSDYQRYRLNDWWSPIAATGGMGGGTFRNINEGQRDRFDVFGEWDAYWTPQWQSQLGIRNSLVRMDTGNVQGYNTTNYPEATYAAFNAADRKKTDNNVDLTALLRYTPNAESSFEAGYARKSRSPNLYERFAWSTNNTMVMNMINWSGEANGYVGNLNLKPEVANTLSATADWHDADKEKWGLKLTPYYTHIQDYIDATRCPVGSGVPCTAANRDARTGFVYLQYVNQTAHLYGADVSAYLPWVKSSEYGSWTSTALVNYVRGKNETTGDNLYNIMPLNARLALVQRLGNWNNTIEGQFVSAKTDVSQVRNELKTSGYSLLNLRSSYEWKQARFDIGIENVLNKFYASPLGGAYVGQRTMTWGTPVPGMGRSIYAAVNFKF